MIELAIHKKYSPEIKEHKKGQPLFIRAGFILQLKAAGKGMEHKLS